MKSRLLYLHNAQQAIDTLHKLADEMRPDLMIGNRFVLSVRPETRSVGQNARFHAICADLERYRLPWAGQPRKLPEWKVLTVSGHAIATNEGAEVVVGLEGELVNLRESTARMSVRRASSLIEYATAFCALHRVPLSDPMLQAYEQEMSR